MEGLEERIQAVLRDPQQMQQIFSIATSLGLELPPQDGVPEAAPEQPNVPASEPRAEDKPPIQPGLGSAITQPVAELLTQAGKLEKKQENLAEEVANMIK